MKQVVDANELLALLRDVRSKASAFNTTWFASRPQAEEWIARGMLHVAESSAGVVIARRDGDFHHIHHWTSTEALAEILGALPRDVTLVADLVARGADASDVADAYRSAGFEPLATLVRMTCPTADLQVTESGAVRAAAAEPSDAAAIRVFLEGLLNPFYEPIPEHAEIEAAAANGHVLIIRRDGAVAGVLFFELHGQTAILRYWWVAAVCRGSGVGAALIRGMFQACAGTRQILLWVVEGNDDAIRKYEHYGFRRDGLVDRIMIRHKERST